MYDNSALSINITLLGGVAKVLSAVVFSIGLCLYRPPKSDKTDNVTNNEIVTITSGNDIATVSEPKDVNLEEKNDIPKQSDNENRAAVSDKYAVESPGSTYNV